MVLDDVYLFVEGAALGGFVELEILEVVVHDFLVLESDLRELAARNFHDLVDTPLAPGVLVVHRFVLGIGLRRLRDDLHAAQRRLMAMGCHARPGFDASLGDTLKPPLVR